METLKKIFYAPSTGLRSSTLYSKAKAIDPSVTHKMTKEFLKKQSVVQVFKPRKIKTFFPLIAVKTGRLQIDLMDMSNEDTVTNKSRKWVFCAVDVFSRYAFCYPQKSKSDSSCLESLTSLIKDCKALHIHIYQIDSDSESSFMSRQFKLKLKTNDITQNLVPIGDKHRVGIVERFNGTVRQYLNRYKLAYKTTNWLKAIPDFIVNYNTSIHSTLDGQTPTEALTGPGATNHMINQTLDAGDKKYNRISFAIGDKVRLRIIHGIFEKKSTGVWTKTVHKIESIKGHDIYVDDRVEPYRKENLLSVDSEEGPDLVDEEKGVEEEKGLEEQKVERRVSRRINKEGIDRQKDIVVDENAKVLRRYRKERDFGPMILV